MKKGEKSETILFVRYNEATLNGNGGGRQTD